MDVCQEVNITKSIQCMVADYLLIHRFNENRAILQHFVEVILFSPVSSPHVRFIVLHGI